MTALASHQPTKTWRLAISAGLLSTACMVGNASELILPGFRPSEPQRLKIWGFEIYDARLWTKAAFSVPQFTSQSFGLEITYLRKVEGKDIAKSSIDEMKRIGQISPEQQKAWLKAMSDTFPSVGNGDKLLGVYKPNEGAEFWINQKPLGVISDPQFAKLFFGIWLHEATSVPAIRRGWMGTP
jgi:hypothetical protein